jgi:CDP-paratose synthetase
VNAILYSAYGWRGETKKVMDYIIDSLDSCETVKMSAGDQILDFIHIDDIMNFFVLLIDQVEKLSLNPIHYHEYHIGTGIGTCIKELANKIAIASTKTPNIQWGAVTPRKRDTTIATADTQLVYDEIGWYPSINLETGIQKYLHTLGKMDA